MINQSNTIDLVVNLYVTALRKKRLLSFLLAFGLFNEVNYEKTFDYILANIPTSWSIPEDYIQSLKANLFSKDWLNETKTQFLSFTKTSLKLK